MSSVALISVSGMTCGACTAAVTEALTQMKGVEDAAVSLITEEAKVKYDETVVSTLELKESIEDCGFEAQITKNTTAPRLEEGLITKVSIQGMTCGSCSASITEALEKLVGVQEVSISLMTSEGSIKHNTNVQGAQIKEIIEDCGFDAQVISSKPLTGGSEKKDIIVTKLGVSGMTCGSCSASIADSLESTNGVLEVAVSLLTEEAVVKHQDDISADQIKEIIEDCGFGCVISSSELESQPGNEEYEEEQIAMQIFGINEHTDLTNLQYNIEALLANYPAVTDYQLAFKDNNNTLHGPIETEANSSAIQAMRSRENLEIYEENENFIDELSIVYNSSMLGIRQLIDALNRVSDDINFIVVNSVDQSSASQLRLLSRVKDIQYWKTNLTHCLMFGIPVIIMGYTQNLKFWSNLMIFPGLYVISILQFALTSHVQFRLGVVFNRKFIQFIRNRGKNATMDVLVCISTLVSFLFSVFSIILSVWLGQTNKPPKLLFDTTCMLFTFISFGKWLENKAKGSTSTALSKLLSLTPTNCNIVIDIDKYEEFLKSQKLESDKNSNDAIPDFPTRNIAIDLIEENDITIVLPGAKIPADGRVVFGQTEIDESIMTGESLPVVKCKGDNVIGGSINGPGVIHIRVLKTGKKSQLQQIINLVKDSQVNKAPVQRFADYIAARFVPSIIMLSAITFSFWIIICYVTHNGSSSLPKLFQNDQNGKFFVCLKLGISVVVVACPCALGLAAPTAVMVGTGVGATNGVLIKGGDILEKANDINIILFDKTGTLTTGDMNVINSKQILDEKLSSSDWWNLVGSVEANSEHPVGRGIIKAAKQELGLNFEEDSFDTSIGDFKFLAGLGIRATIQLKNCPGKSFTVHIGNDRLLKQEFSEINTSSESNLFASLDESVNTVAHVIINDKYGGYLELTDSLAPHTKSVIDYLQFEKNYKIGIITGDQKGAAIRIGKELGIPPCNIFSEVLPIHKDKVIVDLKQKFGGDGNVGIAFIGDGINDAPALAQADIGMAIKSGTDIAIESADIVLMGNAHGQHLVGVPLALDISQATFTKIKMNFLWAAIYNIIMLPFAMGCFLPINIMLPPAAAAAAMALSSVSVVINSLLLKNWKAPSILDSASRFKADYENDIGNGFSLKDSTIEEFNRTKRTAKNKGVFRIINIFRRNRSYGSQYEMLPVS